MGLKHEAKPGPTEHVPVHEPKRKVQRHSPDRLLRQKLVLPGDITISAEKHKGRLVVRVESPDDERYAAGCNSRKTSEVNMQNPVAARLRGEGMPRGLATAASDQTCVTGTAPDITPDLQAIIQRVQQSLSRVKWEKLPVRWPSDDDGLWFFWLPDLPGEVQIESSDAVCPFIVETDKHDTRLTARTPEETADAIIGWLQVPGGRPESPWHAR